MRRNLNEKSKYAILASFAYKPEPPAQILDYQLISNNREVQLYMDGSEYIYSIKGTNTLRDVATDISVFFDTLHTTAHYKRVKRYFTENVLPKKGNKKITVVGHSLGGSLAIELLNEFTTDIDKVYGYNVGTGVARFLKSNILNVFSGLLSGTEGVRKYKEMQGKMRLFTTTLDPLSILSVSMGAEVDSPTQANVHSATNFTNVDLIEDIARGINPKPADENKPIIPDSPIKTLEELTRQDVRKLIRQYAPIHYMANNETRLRVRPIDIKYLKGDQFDVVNLPEKGKTLKFKDELDGGAHYFPEYMANLNGEMGDYPCYIFVLPHPEGFAITFQYVFGFNMGKRIRTHKGKKRFGSHMFDITKSWIVFKNKEEAPILQGWQYHKYRVERPYNQETVEFNGLNATYQYERDGNIRRRLFFHGELGSEVYPMTGKIKYEDKGIIKLHDYTKKDFRLNPAKNYILIMPENYTLISNIATDENGKSYNLSLPQFGLNNMLELNHWGQPPRARVNFGFGVKQFQRSGFNKFFGKDYNERYQQAKKGKLTEFK